MNANAWMLKLQPNGQMLRDGDIEMQPYAPLKLDPAAEVKPDPVIVANCALLHRRAKVGLGKYGINLHDARLSERELIVHALQESLDLANYLQAQLQRYDRVADDGK